MTAAPRLQPCDCEDWKEGIAQIEAAQTMSLIHHGAEYTAAVFRFCPWCGKKRANMLSIKIEAVAGVEQ